MSNNLFVFNDNFDSNKSHKITRGLVTGAVILSLSFLPGCSYNAAAMVNPNSSLEEVSDNTCFDEVLEDNLGTRINMDILEDFIDASDLIHSLKLDRVVSDLPESDYRLTYAHINDGKYYNSLGEEISREDFISEISEFIETYGISNDDVDSYETVINNYYYINGLSEMIDEVQLLKEFKDDIGPEQDRYYYDCVVLSHEEAYVNTWLRDVGYDITSDYGLLLIKSKCCDACDYDETHYSEFIVSPYDEEGGAYVKHTGALGNDSFVKLGTFFGDNDLGRVSLDVTNSQNNDKRASLSDEEFASYSSERNTFLRNAINDYAKVVRQSYKQKGAYIKESK